MTNNQKYNLFLDAVRIIRSLADVFEAIADTYRDATVVEADAKVIDAQEVKELPAEKEVTLEDVRAVLGQKSQAGMTAEVRELIRKYGGTRLSDIDPAQYKALLAEAEVLGNEKTRFSFSFRITPLAELHTKCNARIRVSWWQQFSRRRRNYSPRLLRTQVKESTPQKKQKTCLRLR